jgi:hypothetical protein
MGLSVMKNKQNYLYRFLITILCVGTFTSCVEEPKNKSESISSVAEYEKVIDDIVGPGTIVPDGIQVGHKDIRTESLQIQNSMVRERFRRELSVVDVQKAANQTQYTFNVRVIQRDDQGNPQAPVTTQRKLVLAVTPEGYYQFFGDGTEFTIFSWDYLVGLRGFCSPFETDDSYVKFTCSSLKVEGAVYAPLNVPVRKLSLNRAYEIRDKATGAIETGKLRYTIQIAVGIQEISKVVSFCVEGLQKIEDNVYQLVNCNNVESL